MTDHRDSDTRDKREVIGEFLEHYADGHGRPSADGLLNDLHQNGWQVIERTDEVRVNDYGVALRRQRHDRSWTTTTVVHRAGGQPRPYADSEYVLEVTFEGGHPANQTSAPGLEMPFHTMPPWREPEEQPGVTVIGGPSRDECYATWRKLVLDRIRAYHGWTYDKTVGETGHFAASYLAEFEHVRGDQFSNTYKVKIISPYLD